MGQQHFFQFAQDLAVCWVVDLVAQLLGRGSPGEAQIVPEIEHQVVRPRIGRVDHLARVDQLAGHRQATRLDVVKQVAGDFIENRSGDRVGLILFGSQAYLQAPLTFDHVTLRHFLEEAVIGVAGRETAIGDAIGLAVKRLREAPGGEAVLVLLTDGQNTAGAVSPRQAAKLAAQTGLRIHTIGIGAEQMRVRGLLGTRRVNPSANLDETTLKAIAGATGWTGRRRR